MTARAVAVREICRTVTSPSATWLLSLRLNMALCRSVLLGIAVSTWALCADAFYLPGAAPNDYKRGQPVNLFVNSLTPMLAGNDDAKLVRILLLPCENSELINF